MLKQSHLPTRGRRLAGLALALVAALMVFGTVASAEPNDLSRGGGQVLGGGPPPPPPPPPGGPPGAPPAPPPTPFTDVANSSFENDIIWLYQAGITGGCATRKFCPTARVTREQMASFLTRALDLPPTSSDYFSDDESSAHESDINRLAASGITGGCASGKFCPRANVTREQMASFLARGFRLTATATDYFADDNSSIHEGAINGLAKSGITGGCAPGRFCPRAYVTREQMAAFLHRALAR